MSQGERGEKAQDRAGPSVLEVHPQQLTEQSSHPHVKPWARPPSLSSDPGHLTAHRAAGLPPVCPLGLCSCCPEPGAPPPRLCSPEQLSEVSSAGSGKPPCSTPSPWTPGRTLESVSPLPFPPILQMGKLRHRQGTDWNPGISAASSPAGSFSPGSELSSSPGLSSPSPPAWSYLRMGAPSSSLFPQPSA